ncbi:MAG: glycosyltransferase [Candidatus Krumholzibacteria bacterium]|nr:glycosyltransferase [Candidatus Krumholzibacteria bacterium]
MVFDPPWHVVHVIGALRTGGAEKQLINYLEASDRNDFHHTVLCLTDRGDMADLVAAMDIPIKVHRVRLRNFFRDLSELVRWFRQEKVAVIHTHMFSAAMWGRLAGLKAGVPVLVTTEHGKEPWKKWWQIRLDRWLSGKTFRHIAVSEDVRRIRMKRDGVKAGSIQLIPNGVPIPAQVGGPAVRSKVRSEFGLSENQPVIGSVGRMIEAKAYPVFVEALALARKTLPDLHWLQIGDGPDRQAVMDKAKAMGQESHITFAGRRTDISDLLEAMDVWVMSSIREGLPVALLEAMVAGKSIAATMVGGIPDAVENEVSALLVPENDPRALADSILRLLENRELASRLGGAARERAIADYSIDSVAEKIEKIYREGLNS